MKPHHVCIQTNDYSASLAFYTEALGMSVVKETRGFHGRDYNTWLAAGSGFYIELQTPKDGGRFLERGDAAAIAHMCFMVDDVTEAYSLLSRKPNVAFMKKNGSAIYEVNGEKLMKLVAPEGTIIEFRDGEVR